MSEKDEQIERLLREGKLTLDEARRLRGAADSGTAADRMERRIARHRIRYGPLLASFALLLLVAVIFWWLQDGDPGLVVDSAEKAGSGEATIDLGRLDGERTLTMQRSVTLSYVTFGLLVLALVTGLLAWLYNGLVSAREQVNAGWAQVENQYQRRLDLVPLLIDSVQAYMDHERETLGALTAARSRALSALQAAPATAPEQSELKAVQRSQGEVQSALSRLLALVENYPDLKASRNFLTLQDQIEGTENRIAIERRQYNEFARHYNTRLQTFPSNLVGQLGGFRFKPYFEAQDEARTGLDNAFGDRPE